MSKKLDNSTPTRTIRRPGQKMTKEERLATQEKFLKMLSMTANIRAACMAAGIDRSLVYYWQEHDSEFGMKFNIANTEANDLLFAAAWERGVKGVEKPVVSMGRQVFVESEDGKSKKPLMERVYSDNLLSLLLKARLPEFRDKHHIDADINHSGSIETRNAITIDPRSLNPEQVALLKLLATSMKEQEQEQKP